jgi:hypothetical protein
MHLFALFDQTVILGVSSYPEPDGTEIALNGKGTVPSSNSHRPVATDPLKVQRWMLGVLFEQGEITVGKILHFGGEILI